MIESHDNNATVSFILRTGKWSPARIRAIDRRNTFGRAVAPIVFGWRTIHGVTYLTDNHTEKMPQGDIEWAGTLSSMHRGSLYEFHATVTVSSNPNSDRERRQVEQSLSSILLD